MEEEGAHETARAEWARRAARPDWTAATRCTGEIAIPIGHLYTTSTDYTHQICNAPLQPPRAVIGRIAAHRWLLARPRHSPGHLLTALTPKPRRRHPHPPRLPSLPSLPSLPPSLRLVPSFPPPYPSPPPLPIPPTMAAPAALPLPSPALSLTAHPSRPLLAAGLSTNAVHLSAPTATSTASASPTSLATPSPATSLLFATADTLVSAHAGPTPHLLLHTLSAPASPRTLEHTHPLTALHALPPPHFLSGADDGAVHLHDTRLPAPSVAVRAHHHADYVSALAALPPPHPAAAPAAFLAAAADGALLAYDLRLPDRPLVTLRAAADEFEDDLLALAVLPAVRRAVAGTMSGAVNVYDLRFAELQGGADDGAAHVDRFYGHPECVNAVLDVGDGAVVTASSDGVVRVVDVVGKALLGVLEYDGGEVAGGGEEGARRKKGKKRGTGLWPIEDMVSVKGVQKPLFALLGHEEVVRFVDGAVLVDDDVDGRELRAPQPEERDTATRKRKKKKKRRAMFEEDKPKEKNTFFDAL